MVQNIAAPVTIYRSTYDTSAHLPTQGKTRMHFTTQWLCVTFRGLFTALDKLDNSQNMRALTAEL